MRNRHAILPLLLLAICASPCRLHAGAPGVSSPPREKQVSPTTLDTLRGNPGITVKTNALLDILMMPTIQLEMTLPWWDLSVFTEGTYANWSWNSREVAQKATTLFAGIRKYFGDDNSGHFIEGYYYLGDYDILNSGLVFLGQATGSGVGYGYAFRSDKDSPVKFELFIRAGWTRAYTPFEQDIKNMRNDIFSPASIGVNLSVDIIKARQKSNKGLPSGFAGPEGPAVIYHNNIFSNPSGTPSDRHGAAPRGGLLRSRCDARSSRTADGHTEGADTSGALTRE